MIDLALPKSRAKSGGIDGFIGPSPARLLGKSVWRWVRVFWPLAAVVVAGATSFRGPVVASIASTPHPELVYAIFAVAVIAAVLLARSLHDYSQEHEWFERMAALPVPEQDRMIADRSPGHPLTSLYRVFVQTRGLPLAVRQPALEDEMNGAETLLVGRQSLPNLLAGSLVGLGLVGTFIGLLQTLSDLSGVFAALGGGTSGNSAEMFSTMIVKLQGPMEGMGTAFVASLYGLLGSLVMGLTANGVKSAGERLFGDVRHFVNDDLYPSAAVSFLGLQPADTGEQRTQALSIDQWAQLFAVIREEHRSMRDLFIQWEQSFSKRFDQLSNVASSLNHQLVETVDFVGEQAELNAKRIEEVSTMEGRLAASLDEKGTQVVDQIDSFRKDLKVARNSVLPVFGRAALALAVLGALAGLTAISLSWSRGWRSGAANDVIVSGVAVSGNSATGYPKPAGIKAASQPAGLKPSKATTQTATIVAQPGDSLYSLSLKLNLPMGALLKANPQIANPSMILPGDIINYRVDRPAAAN